MLFTDDAGIQHRVVCGSLRNTGSGWFVVNDSVNEPSDLISVGTVTPTSIQLLFAASSKVHAVTASPDAVFAGSYTVNFGADSGLGTATIKGRLNGGPFNPQTWSHATASIRIVGFYRL